jgi:hypothetical protein
VRNLIVACPLLWSLSTHVGAQTVDHPLLHVVADAVKPDPLKATIIRLVGFGTRHSLSDQNSVSRGIGAAQVWIKEQFASIGTSCGNCLEIATPAETFSGVRIPTPTQFMDILAIQRGSGDPNRVIIIAAHLDSRNSDAMDGLHDAPGADDDGSGVAAVLEAARILTNYKFSATLVYAVLTGEEQGLMGGTVLANYATAQGWNVEADLNNDIVGSSHGGAGAVDATHVRIFSEGTRDLETADQARAVRCNGGEVDSPARNLARFTAVLAPLYLHGFSARVVYRTDRYGRGGDQVPVLAAGFPAVRITEAVENYAHEHQNVRVEDGIAYGDVIAGVDFSYLAQVARLNIVTMAALAMAPAPPTVAIAGAVTYDTNLSWGAVPGAASYRAWWRDSLEAAWSHSKAAGDSTAIRLKNVNIDDWLFGISSVSADGYESPIAFPFFDKPEGPNLTPNVGPAAGSSTH